MIHTSVGTNRKGETTLVLVHDDTAERVIVKGIKDDPSYRAAIMASAESVIDIGWHERTLLRQRITPRDPLYLAALCLRLTGFDINFSAVMSGDGDAETTANNLADAAGMT
jgi:hypothetical protein